MSMMEDVKSQYESALTLEACNKLPSHRLLAYYKKYRWLYDAGLEWCCEYHCGNMSQPEQYRVNEHCIEYMSEIKKILDSRY